jgi:hypothetical protein
MRTDAELTRAYHDALVALDELSLMLVRTLQYIRIGWDESVTCENVLDPISDIAKRIGEVMPDSIVATRPSSVLNKIGVLWQRYPDDDTELRGLWGENK